MDQRVSESTNQRVSEAAAAQLVKHGYGYDTRLCDGDEVSGFAKALGDDVYAIIQFQRRGDEWTINLLRVKSAEIGLHVYGGYPGALGARLGHVIWFVANVREGDDPDRWWTIETLDAALELLIDYGLPWLEDPYALKPWDMPAQRWSEFATAVMDIAGPELLAQGYRAETQSLAGCFPYPYFVKPLANGEYALIEFQSSYSLDPARFMFDVRLQRKTTANPLDFGGAYGDWRAASLGQLVWRTRWTDNVAWSVNAVKSVLWQYADRVELADRLREVLGHVPHIARPWLEGVLDVRGNLDARANHAAATI
jgi:hypothetical protein